MVTDELPAVLRRERVIAVIRVSEAGAIVPTAQAVAGGGIRLLEVALTSPGAIPAIAELAAALPEARVGAGTVLTRGEAEAAVAAGARFLFSPGFSRPVLHVARSAGIAYIPGALTPTEITQLLELGIREIKIFPASSLGPGYIKELRGPFPDLQAIPTGGVGFDNAQAFLDAGAIAVGVGGALTAGGDYETIRRRSGELHALVTQVRR